MFCNSCGKNHAVVHYSQIVNNKVTELHLCEECAQKQGINVHSQFSVPELLIGITNNIDGILKDKIKKELKCDMCGFKYSDFKGTGKLGCANCYIVFKDVLRDLLKRIHGSDNHLGKMPETVSKEVKINKEIIKLKLLLKKAIESENFEKAAEIRDEITKLEKL